MKTLTFISLLFCSSICAGQSIYYGINSNCIYRANEYGAPVTKLHEFNTLDGTGGCGSLVQIGTRLYGNTMNDGLYGYGTMFYYDVASNEFSTIKHLTSEFTADRVTPVKEYNGKYYSTSFTSIFETGKLLEFDYQNNDANLLVEFDGRYTAYGVEIVDEFAYIPANIQSDGNKAVLFKYNLNTNTLEDSLVLDPSVFGSGSAQLLKMNDSTLVMVSTNEGLNNEGSIFAVNINNWSANVLYSFEDDFRTFSPGIIVDEAVYLVDYDTNLDVGTLTRFANGNYDSLFTYPTSISYNQRSSNFTRIDNRLVFSMSPDTLTWYYHFNLDTEEGEVSSVSNNTDIGGLSYFCELTRYSSLSISEENKNYLSIYPNPTSSVTSIVVNEITPIQLLSLEGKILMNETLNVGVNELSLQQFSTGTYILKSANGNQIIVKN